MAAAAARWEDIEIHYRGTVMRSTGHRFSGVERKTLLELLARRAQVARRRGAVAAGDPGPLRLRASHRRPDRRRRRRRQPDPRPAVRPVPAPARLAPQPLRLARQHPPLPRVHLLLQAVAGRALAHPRLPVRARPLDLHRRGAGRRPGRRAASTRTTSRPRSPTWSGCSRRSCRATRSWPTAPSGGGSPPSGMRAGTRATSCCWATPRIRRTSRWARAPSWRWRTRSRWRRRSRPSRRFPRRSPATRPAGVRRWRASSARPRRASSGSSRRSATTTPSRSSSPSTCSPAASASPTRT